jgi:hypothetical protein
MRHMVRLYVDALPPHLFRQSRRSSTGRAALAVLAGALCNCEVARSSFAGFRAFQLKHLYQLPSVKDVAARTSRHLCNSRFLSFIRRNRAKVQNRAVLKGCEMPRADPLFERTMNAWARLDDRRRQRFAEAFLWAALRLERQELRAWLMRRLIEPPLAAPVDPARFAISKTDIALLMRSTREKSGAASATPAKREVGAQ